MKASDPTCSVVVFSVGSDPDDALVTHVPARDHDAIQQAWRTLVAEHGITVQRITGLHATWQPSLADQWFVSQAFDDIEVAYLFPRPDPDGWDAAFEEARAVLEAQGPRHEADKTLEVAADVAASTRGGVVLPVLRSTSLTHDLIAKATRFLPVGDGRLGVTLARVAWTSRGTIGMAHLVNNDFADEDNFFAQLHTAVSALSEGMVLEGVNSNEGQLWRVTRKDGFLGSSTILVPGFHTWISEHCGWSELIVAIACPDELLIAPAGSALAQRWHHTIQNAQPQSPELLPSLLRITADGLNDIQLVVESSAPHS